MNVCALDYPDESFNGVIDKGTLDSVLCGEGSTANVAKMCMEISRVLKPNGVYFICSYGVPDNRMHVRRLCCIFVKTDVCKGNYCFNTPY